MYSMKVAIHILKCPSLCLNAAQYRTIMIYLDKRSTASFLINVNFIYRSTNKCTFWMNNQKLVMKRANFAKLHQATMLHLISMNIFEYPLYWCIKLIRLVCITLQANKDHVNQLNYPVMFSLSLIWFVPNDISLKMIENNFYS